MSAKNRFGLYPNGEPDTEVYYAEWAEQEYGSGNAFLLPDIKGPPNCDLTADELLVSDEDSPSYDYEDYDNYEFSSAEKLDDTEIRRLGISPPATPETAGSNRRAKRLSELASQVVADGRLLLSDSGLRSSTRLIRDAIFQPQGYIGTSLEYSATTRPPIF